MTASCLNVHLADRIFHIWENGRRNRGHKATDCWFEQVNWRMRVHNKNSASFEEIIWNKKHFKRKGS